MLWLCMLPRCSALTLRGLLSARHYTLKLSGVSTWGHFALSLIQLTVWMSLSLSLIPLNCLSVSFWHSSTFSFSLQTFPYICLLFVSVSLLFVYYDKISALARLKTSACSSAISYVVAVVAAAAASPCPLPTVSVPLAPVSRGRQSAIRPFWSGEPQRLQRCLVS